VHTIDLRFNEPRSAHVDLGGVKLLARIIDKGRAAIGGTLGKYCFYDCLLDRVFFEAIHVSRDEFLGVMQQAYQSQLHNNIVALADLRESLESKPEISDEKFMQFSEARDTDNAVVRWLLVQRLTPTSVLFGINTAVDRLPSDAFIDWVKDD
jgi:hypothetical protein